MTDYAFKPGSRLSGDAQPVGEWIVKWLAKHKPEQADEVVAAARPASSPLHDYFLWDDTEAAERYRLEQARHLLRSVVILRPEGDERPAPRLVEFVSNATDDAEGEGTGGYYLTAHVLRTPELAARFKARLRVDLSLAAEKLRAYEALSVNVERRINGLSRALELELDTAS